jgi:hypothetical protein
MQPFHSRDLSGMLTSASVIRTSTRMVVTLSVSIAIAARISTNRHKALIGLAVVPSLMMLTPLVSLAHGATSSVICMARATQGAAGDRTFTTPVPPSRAFEMAARGFIAQPCNGKEISTPQFQRAICAFVASAPGVQASFKTIYGVSPAELCALATSVIAN